MARACCPKPNARIIKVAECEVGLVGLDQALRNVYMNGLDSEEAIQRDLLQRIKEFGNYIPASRENHYKDALFREYRKYITSVQGEGKEDAARSHPR